MLPALLAARPFAPQAARRWLSASSASILANSEAERQIAQKLAQGIQGATSISVEDTRGGCGTFYRIDVTAREFRGLSTVKQHQIVYRVLEAEVAQWHGLNLTTKAAS